MKTSNVSCPILVNILICSIMGSVKSQMPCPPPDVPAEGNYLPQSKKFISGDKVTYFCNEGFILMGKEVRTCKSLGAWSDHTPFCDRQAKLKSLWATNTVSPILPRVIDGSTQKCFLWENSVGHDLQVYIDKQAVVLAVRIFLEKGTTRIQILSGRENNMKVCSYFDRFLERRQWVLIICKNSEDVLADSIKIKNIRTDKRSITLCEIQVYVKDEYGCDNPPNKRVANGFFEVSRNKAQLYCEDGFTAVSSRLVCEDNAWLEFGPRCDENLCQPFVKNVTLNPGTKWVLSGLSLKLSPGTTKQLKCSPGYKKVGGPDSVICQKNGWWTKTNATCIAETPKTSKHSIIIGAVGALVIIIIVLLLAIIIYFLRKQRIREVGAVFKLFTDVTMTPKDEAEHVASLNISTQDGAPIISTTPCLSADCSMIPGTESKYLTDHYISMQSCDPIPSTMSNPSANVTTIIGIKVESATEHHLPMQGGASIISATPCSFSNGTMIPGTESESLTEHYVSMHGLGSMPSTTPGQSAHNRVTPVTEPVYANISIQGSTLIHSSGLHPSVVI